MDKKEKNYQIEEQDREVMCALVKRYGPEIPSQFADNLSGYLQESIAKANGQFNVFDFCGGFVTLLLACATAIANGKENDLRSALYDSSDNERSVQRMLADEFEKLVNATRLLYSDILSENSLDDGVIASRNLLFKDALMEASANIFSQLAISIDKAIVQNKVTKDQVKDATTKMRAQTEAVLFYASVQNIIGNMSDERLKSTEDLHNGLVLHAKDRTNDFKGEESREAVELITVWSFLFTMINSGYAPEEVGQHSLDILVSAGLPGDFMASRLAGSMFMHKDIPDVIKRILGGDPAERQKLLDNLKALLDSDEEEDDTDA